MWNVVEGAVDAFYVMREGLCASGCAERDECFTQSAGTDFLLPLVLRNGGMELSLYAPAKEHVLIITWASSPRNSLSQSKADVAIGPLLFLPG